MSNRTGGLIGILLLTAAAGPAAGECKLNKLGELPVTISRGRALVDATINGAPAHFILNTGAVVSRTSPAVASQYNLPLRPSRTVMLGFGGTTPTFATTVQHFAFTGFAPFSLDLLVAGTDYGGEVAGLIGQNVLWNHDVEFDLANGVIRFMQPEGCGKSSLAYWNPAQPYSVIDVNWANEHAPLIVGTAYVNGMRIQAKFDTGVAGSVLTREAANLIGAQADGAGVVPAGFLYGVGPDKVKSWIAPVASFKIGEEEIRNTRLRFGDFSSNPDRTRTREQDVTLQWDMLLGMDFFLSHHLYVANSQHKVYFTYNGGQVFNLGAPTGSPAAAAAAAETPTAPPGGTDEPTDAAGFSRRGTAFAARHDLEHAIADLTRACELAPAEAAYFYQLGLAHRENRQPELAMTDFDNALKLAPHDLDTLIARAQLRLAARNPSGASEDLNTAAQVAPKEAQQRLRLGQLFSDAGQFTSAIEQFDLWLPAHGDDALRFEALAGRCWARALGRQDLDQALVDCNAALHLSSDAVLGFNARGLLLLRLGNFDRSIADYDQALKLQPKSAWALYGRGVDESHKGMSSAAQADFAAALAMHPHIDEQARNLGISP